jgi:cytidyltransferase-like protein
MIKTSDRYRRHWKCICKCGNITWVRPTAIIANTTKSCGCNKGHGHKIEYGLASKRRVFRRYNRDAGKHNREFALSFEQFIDLCSKDCFYCGGEPSNIQEADANNGHFIYNGIDRVDNDVGYIEGNCVPCCFLCNSAKKTFNKDVFLNWVSDVHFHQKSLLLDKKYQVFFGRFQPFHYGHMWLINKQLCKEVPILILVRDMPPDEKNPFTTKQTVHMIKTAIGDEGDVIVEPVVDIQGLNYGRDVGYEINEFTPPEDIGRISATEIRNAVKNNDDFWKGTVDPKIHGLIIKYLGS